jgi:hypothetical protein
MSLTMAQRVCDALTAEPQLHSLHLAGGEPTIKTDLLVDIVRLLTERRLPLAYVETNASWCRDREHTRRQLDRLREAGLPALLVSVSMFHNEFVPFSFTRNCVETASTVFGPENVIVYLPHMYELLSRMPDDATHTLTEFCKWVGVSETTEVVPRLYQVIPAGRATQALRHCYVPHPAAAFRGQSCRSQLLGTTHFHLDHHGDLFTGLCAGIAPAGVNDLHPRLTPETHPVFCLLCTGGPFGLMEMATAEYGYSPRVDGYVSSCDLCFAVRRHLVQTGEFAELRPASFYQE